MNNYKVFIPVAGVNGHGTHNLNKALLTVGLKPGISYIIEKFDINTPIVVALGHQGDLIKDFLELAYPKHNFEFVEIKPFDGPESGLGLTMLQCKEKLQCPFIFCSGDTIVEEKIPEPKENWIGYSESEHNDNKYRRLEIINNEVTNIYGKEIKDSNFLHIGLVGIYDYEKFWDTMESQKELAIKVGESIGLKGLQDINANKFTWFDTGNFEALKKTRDELTEKDGPNILPKEDEAIWFIGDKVIKYHIDEEFISKRVERVNNLGSYVPKIVNSRKHFYVYDKVPGEIFSKKAMLNDFKYLLEWLNNFWIEKKLDKEESNKFKKICDKFYREKTISRIKKYFSVFEQIDSEETINGINIPKVMDLIEQVDWEWMADGLPVRYHGDLHFENILITENTKSPFTLLDWRQNFGGIIEYGDIYYDLAKLNHGLIMCHELVNKELFTVSKKTNIIEFDFLRKQNLVDCEHELRRFCENNKYDYKKVEMLTYLIYLNIAGLHHYPYSLLLFYLGKSGLHRLLKNGNTNKK